MRRSCPPRRPHRNPRMGWVPRQKFEGRLRLRLWQLLVRQRRKEKIFEETIGKTKNRISPATEINALYCRVSPFTRNGCNFQRSFKVIRRASKVLHLQSMTSKERSVDHLIGFMPR